MKFDLRVHKPFQYKVYNNKAELEEYSGGFLSEEAAIQWYEEHGKWLEKQFKRTLVLIKNDYQEKLTFNF